MKTRLHLPLAVALAAVFLLPWTPVPGGTLCAQDEGDNNSTSSTTYDSTGKVTAISPPSTITVAGRGGPFTYRIAPDVFVFTAKNKAVGVNAVHVGQTVTVYYYKRLGQETVGRVVILEPATGTK